VSEFSLKLPRNHRTLRALLVLPNTRHRIAIITPKDRSLSGIAHVFVNGVRAVIRASLPAAQGEAAAGRRKRLSEPEPLKLNP
jgi:hypothetical protein